MLISTTRPISCTAAAEYLGDNIYGTYTSLYYGNGDPKQQYEFWQKCKDITNDAGKIVSTFVNGSVDSEKKDKMLKEYKSILPYPDSVYYRVQTTDDIVLVEMIDLDTSTFFLTYADKSRRQDIVRIMTGNESAPAEPLLRWLLRPWCSQVRLVPLWLSQKRKRQSLKSAVNVVIYFFYL